MRDLEKIKQIWEQDMGIPIYMWVIQRLIYRLYMRLSVEGIYILGWTHLRDTFVYFFFFFFSVVL